MISTSCSMLLYLSFSTLFAIITIVPAKSRIQTSIIKKQNCGDAREGYQAVQSTSITPNLIGQKIMVTSTIQRNYITACTYMMCHPDHPCCNTCRSSLRFENIILTAWDGVELGCIGDDCEIKCTYDDQELVTVYGVVSSNGNHILVEDHCKNSVVENE